MLYRKRPDTIEAFKWMGNERREDLPDWFVKALDAGKVVIQNPGTPDMMISVDYFTPRKPGEGYVALFTGEMAKGLGEIVVLFGVERFEECFEPVT